MLSSTLSSLIIPAIFTVVGVLIRHLWPSSTPAVPSPTPSPAPPIVAPSINLPGLLNSPIVAEILKELEAQFLSNLKLQVGNMAQAAPPATPKV